MQGFDLSVLQIRAVVEKLCNANGISEGRFKTFIAYYLDRYLLFLVALVFIQYFFINF